jgi:hypothetical protein
MITVVKLTHKITAFKLTCNVATVKPTWKVFITIVTVCSERYCCIEGSVLM